MVSAALGTLTWAPANGPHRAHSVEFRRAFAIGVKDAETRPAMAGVAIDIDFFDGYQVACPVFHTCFCVKAPKLN
jgi:hypothetical protein